MSLLLIPTTAPERITSNIAMWLMTELLTSTLYPPSNIYSSMVDNLLSLRNSLIVRLPRHHFPCLWKYQYKSWQLQKPLSSLLTAWVSCKHHTAVPRITVMVTNGEHELRAQQPIKDFPCVILFNPHNNLIYNVNVNVPILEWTLREVKSISHHHIIRDKQRFTCRSGWFHQLSFRSEVGHL